MSALPSSFRTSENFPQFLFYQPSSSSAAPAQIINSEEKPRKPGRPKGSRSFTPYVPSINSDLKRPVGRPRGTGHKQLAEKEIERQKCENPAPYAAVGLTVPATGSTTSTWGEIFRQPTLHCKGISHPASLLSPSNIVLSRSLPSVPYQSNSVLSSSLTLLPNQSNLNADPPLCGPSSVSSSSRSTVVERAQYASSATEAGRSSETSKLPSISNLTESFAHLIDLDEDEIAENSVDSLLAEGIGEDDIGEDEDEQEDEEHTGTEDETSHRRKWTLRPYPTWFQTHLSDALDQIKADRGCLSGQLRFGQWFWGIYDGFIESHKQSFHQHTAMLTGRICAIDHSHKLAKHITKVDGVPIFTALLTVTNDKGEIRICNFVATKSHSQFTDALKQMHQSLDLYGHQQPEIFYTDNMADKGMLEECFPSLLEDITPVEKHSNLPLLSVPVDIIHVLSMTEEIDNALQALMEHLAPSDSYLAVGFDTEWNVDVSEDGRVRGRGPTTVVQIALKDEVYILQLALQKLPHQLVMFLCERRILKAGRMANGDLHHLETLSGQGPFLGGLELGSFAKEWLLITDARVSLSDLTAEILGKCLPKNKAEQISTNWTDTDLSSSQIEYAAKDAYASLLLFHQINKTPLPMPVTVNAVPNTPLIILSNDQTKIIAHSILDNTDASDGIPVTST
ncbi:hypothetical protein GYMLUDRAFT_262146 [Collybiopsis luxurians FD-317 M1]|uniref:3'-5' exonuclease n=1 Tax=Collybiopsis luxurians FD-317 M1 TaxID=944289 RepID=A0A0D0C986_9AGAR|nr:hypothetical protein GYMLUDRAFT_262146 [Collybiopsis luxurians FD-317 M1]